MQKELIVISVFALALALLCACSSVEQPPAVPTDAASAPVSENAEAPASAPDQAPDAEPVSDRSQILPPRTRI